MPKISHYKSNKSAIHIPTPEEDRSITIAAKSDPDAQPLTPKQLKAMIPLKGLRGRPQSEHKKVLVSVRYSPEVITYFRSTGDGWQGRMDKVLHQYVTKNFQRAREILRSN
ncbi:MAG: BrnA antitoxin family protein [Patescibacteria group bacterium]